ncbi:MAG: CPBP family intramembrane metalloprotease, partial [Bacteroidales bacterium]|nr:CPBP family intramembrane metalloprotease [Bacteroidales bacterium]
NNNPQEINSQQPLFNILQIFPPFIVYALILIGASVFEEFAFRGWIIKKKFGKYLSFSLILTFLYLGFESIWLIAIVSPILFFIFFVLKNEKLRLVLLIISTSILFGIMHYENYESWAKLFAIIQLIGLSFILCYVGLRFGFIFTILGHFLNNLIALMLLTVFANTDYAGKFENTTYTAEISKISSFDFSSQMHWIFPDSISTNGYITEIASDLPSFKNGIIYKFEISDINRYLLIATSNSEDKINEDQLFNDFVQHTGLVLDTSYSEAYIMIIEDSLKLLNYLPPAENRQETNVESLSTSIREIYKLPLILDDDYRNYSFDFDWKLYRIKSSEEFIDRLNKECGILITKDSKKQATIVTIRE